MKTRPCSHCLGTGQEPDQAAIGADLRARRIAAGISLRTMAAKLLITPPYLSDLELGRRRWMPKYADAYPKSNPR